MSVDRTVLAIKSTKSRRGGVIECGQNRSSDEKARKAPKARGGLLIYSSDKKALKTQKAPKVLGG